jgi:hypothetical protein
MRTLCEIIQTGDQDNRSDRGSEHNASGEKYRTMANERHGTEGPGQQFAKARDGRPRATGTRNSQPRNDLSYL